MESIAVDAPVAIEDAREARSLLSITPPFSGLADDDFADLLSFTSWDRVVAKEVIFRQGEPRESLFVLVDGSLKLVRKINGEREHVVRLITPGEVFPETALFANDGHKTSAIALERSRLLRISAKPFAEFLREHPNLAWNVLVGLGNRIEELATRAELLATHSAEQKVAAYLLRRYRSTPAGVAVVEASCRRSDLASLLALAPETLCRIVTEFKRREWIRSDNGRILVLDADALAEIAPD